MTELDPLLAAVLAQPDDDLPRLVYADALDETGHPAASARAEFIRGQVALAANPDDVGLKARTAALLAAHGAAWLAPLRQKGEPLQSPSTHGVFRRGFVEVVWMPAAWFL